jgi:hypothetical protein
MANKSLQRYLDRCDRSGEDPNPKHIKMYEDFDRTHEHRFDSPEHRVNNLEWDIVSCGWMSEKVRSDNVYAQNLYAAFCNNEFQKLDVVPILKNETWSCSWRSAGGIIAEIRGEGDYIDWYCSGIMSDPEEDGGTKKGYVSESTVTEEIEQDLKRLGWIVIKD